MEQTVRVGIDLGTTNTLVSADKKGKITCLKFDRSTMLPSVVYINEEGTLDVGSKALAKGVNDPNNCIKSAKTWMGDYSKKWSINERVFTPTDVAIEVLKVVKQTVVKRLKLNEQDIIEAVITVPAYFTSNQIDETRKAGEKAGLKVSKIVTEPMAAAIAYSNEVEVDKKIFVIDIGGGTFDISVLEADYNNNVYNNIAVDGDKKLGGDDFDECLIAHFIEIIEEDIGIDLSSFEKSGLTYEDYHSMRGRIMKEAENTKVELSDSDEVEILIPNLFEYKGKSYSFETVVNRELFDELCENLYDRIEDIITKLLKTKASEGKFTINDIGRVVLVGGTCYIPAIKDRMKKLFNQPVYTDMDLSTMVVQGACILATSNDGLEKIEIKDIISHSLGIEVQGSKGAELEKILLKDTVYPNSNSKTFTTSYDNQESVDINVYEGENIYDLDKNEFYGSFTLDGVEKAPKGKPQIKVEFKFDENRILEVCATDLKTKSYKIVKMKKGEKVTQTMQKPMDLMLLMDASGSMRSRMVDAKNACTSLINDMIDFNVHRLGIVKFTSSATLLNPLTSNKSQLLKTVESITTSGSTNMHDAIKVANNTLKRSENEKVIIIVTDGYPDNENLTKKMANDAKNSGIRVISIGAGHGVDYTLLEKISSNVDKKIDSYRIDEMSKLTETFKTIISSLSRC